MNRHQQCEQAVAVSRRLQVMNNLEFAAALALVGLESCEHLGMVLDGLLVSCSAGQQVCYIAEC